MVLSQRKRCVCAIDRPSVFPAATGPKGNTMDASGSQDTATGGGGDDCSKGIQAMLPDTAPDTLALRD
ncbi:hypothetical protein FOT80_13145 [Serratia fonticola]|uniref:hypothetical protein n=1 Tax=Serratia fonticola TaxID=47917 RepID=UPI0016480CE7|nr:hypothetical protein [Serratia fonticola]MBC3231750.1 hypothetical protein [Serratia fonticola]MBE0150346.1 hypothetical protein [Serratia fonticola]